MQQPQDELNNLILEHLEVRGLFQTAHTMRQEISQLQLTASPSSNQKTLPPSKLQTRFNSLAKLQQKLILMENSSPTGKIIKLKQLKLQKCLEGHSFPIREIAFHPSWPLLASSSSCASEGIRLWNAVEGIFLGVILAHAEVVSGLAFHPAIPSLLASCSLDGSVRISKASSFCEWKIDAGGGNLWWQEGGTKAVDWLLNAEDDGNWLLVCHSADGELVILDVFGEKGDWKVVFSLSKVQFFSCFQEWLLVVVVEEEEEQKICLFRNLLLEPSSGPIISFSSPFHVDGARTVGKNEFVLWSSKEGKIVIFEAGGEEEALQGRKSFKREIISFPWVIDVCGGWREGILAVASLGLHIFIIIEEEESHGENEGICSGGGLKRKEFNLSTEVVGTSISRLAFREGLGFAVCCVDACSIWIYNAI